MKKIVSTILILLITSFLFAQNTGDMMEALKAKDLDSVKSILEAVSDEDSELTEELVLEEAKRAVKKDDLEYAYNLANMVLMNNFDNIDAQNLFTSIEKAKKSKAEVAAKEAEKERKRLEEEEKLRKIEEYNAQKQKEAEEKEEYEKSVTTITKENFPVRIGISPVSLEFAKSDIVDSLKEESEWNNKYGAGLHLDVGFNHPYFLANLHLNYDYLFLSFSENGQKSDFMGRLTVGSPLVSNYVRLSVGYNWFNYIDDNNSVLLQQMKSPTLGIGLENLNFGELVGMNFFVDVNTMTFYAQNGLDLAFDGELSMRVNLPVKIADKFGVFVENNTVFNAYVFSQNWEYSIGNRILVGVSINE